MKLSFISALICLMITTKVALSAGPLDAIYKITAKNTGKVAGALPGFGAFANYGALGAVDSSSSSLDQQFIITKHSGDWYKIAPKSKPNQYLTATVPGLSYPICLHVAYDDSYPVDQWKFTSAGNGLYTIENRYYGTSVFEVAYESSAAQKYIYQRTKTGQDKQLFGLEKVACLTKQPAAAARFRAAAATLSDDAQELGPDPTIDLNEQDL